MEVRNHTRRRTTVTAWPMCLNFHGLARRTPRAETCEHASTHARFCADQTISDDHIPLLVWLTATTTAIAEAELTLITAS